MSSAIPLPPTVLLPNSTRQVPIADAQQIIAAYLRRSEKIAHLHPDAVLQSSGPSHSTQGGPKGGLIIDQLRRVEAGLRGVVMKPAKLSKGEKESDDSKLDALIAEAEAQERAAPRVTQANSGGDDTEFDTEAEQGFAATDGEEVGEVGDRHNLVEYDGDVPEVEVPDPADKAARKAAKQARREARRQAKETAEKKLAEHEDNNVINGVVDGVNSKEEKKKKKKKRKLEEKASEAKDKKHKKKKAKEQAAGD